MSGPSPSAGKPATLGEILRLRAGQIIAEAERIALGYPAPADLSRREQGEPTRMLLDWLLSIVVAARRQTQGPLVPPPAEPRARGLDVGRA